MNKEEIIFTKEEHEKLCDKNSFLINKTLFEDIKEMGDGEVRYLMYVIFEYVIDGVIPDLTNADQRFVRVAFNRFKSDYVKDSKKWLTTCKKKSDRKKDEWKKRKEEEKKNTTV